MRYLILVLMLALVGCNQGVDSNQIRYAESLCTANGGLKYVERVAAYEESINVLCMNRAEFNFVKEE